MIEGRVPSQKKKKKKKPPTCSRCSPRSGTSSLLPKMRIAPLVVMSIRAEAVSALGSTSCVGRGGMVCTHGAGGAWVVYGMHDCPGGQVGPTSSAPGPLPAWDEVAYPVVCMGRVVHVVYGMHARGIDSGQGPWGHRPPAAPWGQRPGSTRVEGGGVVHVGQRVYGTVCFLPVPRSGARGRQRSAPWDPHAACCVHGAWGVHCTWGRGSVHACSRLSCGSTALVAPYGTPYVVRRPAAHLHEQDQQLGLCCC